MTGSIHPKVHAIILLTMLVVIALLVAGFNLFSSWLNPPVESATVVGTQYVTIVTGSYGLNCKMPPRPTPLPGTVAERDPEAKAGDARINNVRDKLAALCDHQPSCPISANKDALGFDGLPDCGTKDLYVEYRCFSYDKAHAVTLHDGNSYTIDCVNLKGDDAP